MTQAPLRIYYDGLCPICRRAAVRLRKLDRGRGRLELIDFSSPAFDAASAGVSPDELLGSIHARLPDGRLIRGMEVFRYAARALGRGWLLAPTGWPGLRQASDRLYRFFAQHRPRGRCSCAPDRCPSEPHQS
ncbi:MAG: DUF393 domain-containing protein [Phycisphaerales bacterium]